MLIAMTLFWTSGSGMCLNFDIVDLSLLAVVVELSTMK